MTSAELIEEPDIEVPSLVQNKKPGMQGFIQTLAGYYSNFLETDFKKARQPKRKYASRDAQNNRVGFRTEKFPSFRSLILGKLDQKSPASFLVGPGKYKAAMPAAIRAGINSSIGTVTTTGVSGEVAALRQQIATADREDLNLERLVEGAENKLAGIIDRNVVAGVIGLLRPVFEGNSNAAVSGDQLETYSEEIVQRLISEVKTGLPTAVSELLIGGNEAMLADLLETLADEQRVKQVLTDYFADFGVSDVFTQLREIVASKALMDNAQIYINFGEIRFKNAGFPLYYLPIEAELEPQGVRLTFETHVFVNKKAIDYLAGELTKSTGTTVASPVTERIFYKDPGDSYLDVADVTVHQILAGVRAEGELDLRAQGATQATGTEYKVSNDITFSLCDRSDESIVNDYEALMTASVEGGAHLMAEFSALIQGFLTQNPVSVDRDVENAWSEKTTPERLVFESPLPLAEEQRKILHAANHADARFISVEGPPGTGKSHTIAAIAFEMILRGKSILVLSDKQEALDVVQSKLNAVIERIRGGDGNFVNPILRLGKSDSNYANIIKNSAIQNLKTAANTFRSHESSFNETFDNLYGGIKENVQLHIDAAEAIEYKDIAAFHKMEAELLERYPHFANFTDDDARDFDAVARMYELVNRYRGLFAEVVASEKEFVKVGFMYELQPVFESIPRDLCKIAETFPAMDVEKAHALQGIADDVEDARMFLFGYLFAGKKLRAASREIEAITGKKILKPQERLNSLRTLAKLHESLAKAATMHGVSSTKVGLLYRMLAEGYQPPAEGIELYPNYLSADHGRLSELGIPATIGSMLGAQADIRTMFEARQAVEAERGRLEGLFADIPDFDYLKAKSDFEDLNAQKLAATIDQRVVDFVETRRADAKTLQQIIRDKGKFPVDKFEYLKEAFPCMIAGLREFAEFIPFQPELFDLVIIDEGSQVSIAQALPAILRAKKMIVMGDRRQFGNVKTANASKALNNAYFSEVRTTFNDVLAKGDSALMTRCARLNITNSVMDFFELVTNYSIQLRKHFRGYPEIIGFSSKYFYENTLQVLKMRGKPIEDVIEFIVSEDPDRFEELQNANAWEANVIVDRMETLLEQESPPSVAVITPHREQQQYVSRVVGDHSRYQEFMDRLKLAIFTFDTCQGEERDVIFYSMTATRENDRLNYIFPRDIRDVTEDELDGKLRFQRLNVGFSRGKEKLVFVLSKPVDEYKGSTKQALQFYQGALADAKDMPTAEDVDQSSPMEAQLLEWIKATSFATGHLGDLEIIPQFNLGAYLKQLDPTYSHPEYTTDFLLRLRTEEGVKQVIIEYDGFEYHFKDRRKVDASNWQHYLTEQDVERECVLESYGYKMMRVNRFNVGKDPVSTLDARLKAVFEEFDATDTQHETIAALQAVTSEHVKGLAEGTHKKCSTCERIQPIDEFYDESLKSGYGRKCLSCKRYS